MRHIALAWLFLALPTLAGDPVYRIYLAGPEVFLPEPLAAGREAKRTIAALNARHDWPFRLEGLYPLDNEIEDFDHNRETGLRIYRANLALMDRADAIAANTVRFRGPSMDVGTAFEMGYMAGQGKPVFAYYDAEPFYGKDEDPGLYRQRVAHAGLLANAGAHRDRYGQSVERFGMADNLMLIGALQPAAGTIADDLEEVVMQVADHFLARRDNNGMDGP